MKEIFSKLWVKITAIGLAVLLFLFSVLLLLNSFAPYNPKCYHFFGLSGISGSFNKKGNPKNYFQVENTANVIELAHLNALNSSIYYVWINVSDMVEDSVIYLYNGSDASGTMTLLSEYNLTGSELSNDSDGWICIYDGTAYTKDISKHFYLGTKNKMRIREVVLLNSLKSNSAVSFSTDDLVRRGNPTANDDSLCQVFNYDNLKDSNSFTTTFTPQLKEKLLSLPNLNDEQSTFNKAKVTE